ncbi:MAG: hypothetical protein ACFFCQ_00165 [Promethearchaeota archaeon]
MTEPDEDLVNLYFEALRETPTPFDNFVSRMNRPDQVDVENSHKIVEREVFRALRRTTRDKLTRFVPIIGEAGSGKTHFYWYLRKRQNIEKNWECVYIPSPPTPIRISLHIYTCIMNEIGRRLLEGVAQELAQKFTKRGKLFRKKQYLATVVARTYPGLATDIVRVLITFAIDKKLKPLAERWFLAENLNEEELETLGVQRIIEEDDTILITLKTLLRSYSKTILFYFDELEIPYRTRGPEAETRFLEYLKRIYNEFPQVLLVSACLTEMWERVLQTADSAIRTRMELPTHLQPFSREDLERYYQEKMKIFWEKNENVDPPHFDPLFPLNQTNFEQIIKQTRGNPRESIKHLNTCLENAITIYEEIKETKGLKEVFHTIMQMGAIQSTISTEEIMTIELNPSTIMSGVLDAIILRARKTDIPLQIELEVLFYIRNNPERITARLTVEGQRIGLEVPSVKSFDRGGGVAAYYSLKRLISAKGAGVIDSGLLIIPEDTSGKKFQILCEQAKGSISVIKLDTKTAEEVIRGGFRKKLVSEAKEVIDAVFSGFKEKDDNHQ